MKPNYYAIIPANVRYDDRLTPNAKLLYGEITALSNKKGFCYASNGYFAELYQVSKVSISKWVNQLIEFEYIVAEHYMDLDKKTHRKLFLNPQTKLYGGIKEKLMHNSIVNSNNNININTRKSKTTKKVSDFADNYLKCYDAIVELFPQRTRPKTTAQKIKWLDTIRLADEKDNCNPRQLWWIINKARKDSFWGKNVLSIPEIRKSKEGKLPKLEQLIQKLGGREFDALQ